jgi:hypothetical protein
MGERDIPVSLAADGEAAQPPSYIPEEISDLVHKVVEELVAERNFSTLTTGGLISRAFQGRNRDYEEAGLFLLAARNHPKLVMEDKGKYRARSPREIAADRGMPRALTYVEVTLALHNTGLGTPMTDGRYQDSQGERSHGHGSRADRSGSLGGRAGKNKLHRGLDHGLKENKF